MQFLVKFESKSNRVKGLAFHPTRPLLAASLHNGNIQLWNYRMGVLVDRFDEHDGPVRGVHLHPTRPLLVSGGDDYKVKVWDIRPQNRKCLFTLHGHLDYVRTVQFHHEMPWIISASDDQTIRIWNSTSRNCIAILTGHSHYIMSAQFHPKDDLVVSASMDQTVRVWDISGLRRGTPSSNHNAHTPANFEATGSSLSASSAFDSFSTVKYVLEGHDRGVNYATFHPTLPLIVSAGDDRQVKLWRMSETKAWEVDTCRGHFNNANSALFHPRHELIISAGEDKTVRVWDMGKRTAVQTFRREHDRFWMLAAHPDHTLYAAGHDNGLIVFKLERERPAFAVHLDTLYYIKDKYVRQHDFNTKTDVGLLSVRKLGSQYIPPRTLSFNPAERAVVVHTTSDGGVFDVAILGRESGGSAELKDSSLDGKRGSGSCAIWVARNRLVTLDKPTQKIEIRDLSNAVMKTIKIPVVANELFYGGTSSVLITTATNVVLYDVQQQKTLAEIAASAVKYVVWSPDNQNVALLSKHAIILANKTLTQSHSVHETIRIKSGAWDESGVFLYSTLNHIKYCLPQGDKGVIKTLDEPVYLTRVKGKTVHCLDRTAQPTTLTIDPTEYLFKLALHRQNFEEMLRIMKTSNLVGQSIISYLQQKGFPEIALHFVQEKNTRFDLAIECGNLHVAHEMAVAIGTTEVWNRLAEQSLQQGNYEMAELAYQRTKNFDRLSFLYLASGRVDRLAKMQKIAELRGDAMSRFHNTLYTGDVATRLEILKDVGMFSLAYATARSNALSDAAQEILNTAGLSENDVADVNYKPSKTGPPKVVGSIEEFNWPSTQSTKNFFEQAMVNGNGFLGEDDSAQVNGVNEIAASSTLDDWAAGNVPNDVADDTDEDEAGWDIDGEDDGLQHEPGVDGMDGVDEELTPGASHGVSESELWLRNSPFAADHVAAGAFESAMQLLNRQVGVVNFTPLKGLFMAQFFSSHAYFTPTASMAPLHLHLRRNIKDSSPSKVLPVAIRTLTSSRAELQEAYTAITKNDLSGAKELLVTALRAMLLVVVTSDDEATEWRDLITNARDYLIGACIELKRRALESEEPDNTQRNLELAALFTHCGLQPPHLKLALRNAININRKLNNHASAAKFARRLIELNPDPKVLQNARSVVAAGDRNPRDAVLSSLDEHTEFTICAATLTPIYRGSPSITCPYTGASYLPKFNGKLDPLLQLTELGAPCAGLPAPR